MFCLQEVTYVSN